MLTNGNRSGCGFSDDIISYIYDEIATADRRRFESHLAGCAMCSEDFAALSDARFSVFEWRREEFAPLATPEIVIPYAAKISAEDADPRGIWTAISGLLSIPNPQFAFAALLAVLLGVGFLAVSYFRALDKQVAANVNVPSAVSPEARSGDISSKSTTDDLNAPETTGKTTTANSELRSGPQPVRAAEHARPVHALRSAETRNSANNVAVQTNQKPKTSKAPVLSNYDDNEDKSLRLADLFEEEVGARR